MNQFIKVAGDESLVRDASSGAIINTNQIDYENYLRQSKVINSKQDQIDCHEIDINIIKNDVAEIKAILKSMYHQNK
jgi:hypothetical protein